MESIKGMFMRGSLYDKRAIYLVEANRRIYSIFPAGPGSYICSVTNSGALNGAHIKGVGPVEVMGGENGASVETYEVRTNKGICLISVISEYESDEPAIDIKEFFGDPSADIAKLHDF